MNTYSTSKNNFLGPLMVAIMTFIPLSTIGNLLRFGIVVLLFLIKLGKNPNVPKRLMNIFVAMLVSIILPICTVSIVEHSANVSSWLHEVMRLAFYVLLIMVVYDFKVSFKTVYVLCIVILLIHTGIQVMQWMEMEEVNNFIRQYYLQPGTNDVHLRLTEASMQSGEFRSGSIYMNPNVYMVVPSIILCTILQANILKHTIWNYLWTAVALFSLLLTGSRTTFFVAVTVVGVYLFWDKEISNFKWVVVAIIVCLGIWKAPVLEANFRVFNLSSGMESSFAVKIAGLLAYLKNAETIYFLTGSLSSSLNVHIDAEWGYILAYFGVPGLYWYIKFIELMGRNKKKLAFQVMTSKAVICLIAMTASIVLCMPIFSFFCLVTLVEIEV